MLYIITFLFICFFSLGLITYFKPNKTEITAKKISISVIIFSAICIISFLLLSNTLMKSVNYQRTKEFSKEFKPVIESMMVELSENENMQEEKDVRNFSLSFLAFISKEYNNSLDEKIENQHSWLRIGTSPFIYNESMYIDETIIGNSINIVGEDVYLSIVSKIKEEVK